MSVAANDTDDWETRELAPVVAVQPKVVMTGSSSSAIADTTTGVDTDDMDAPTSAFRNLRLVAPPSMQDGGAFDRVDPFQRQQQPSPQHALFDPNGNYTQPVSMATATAAVAQFGPLDPVLLAALENSRERLSLLKFEDQIVRFIKNPREMQLNFPPLSSYHRLIIHRLAERCCLEHQTADFNTTAYTQGYDSNAARVVTLFKTAQTIIPRVLLIDLSAEKQQPAVTPATAPKIMVRKRNATRGNGNGAGGHGGGAQDAKNQQRSIEDRERAYAEARARIFGEASSSASDAASSVSTGSGTTGADKSGTAAAVVASASAAPKLGNSQQAAGPDGSRGFGRGNGGSGGRGNGGPSGSNAASNYRQQQDAAAKTSRTAPSTSRPTAVATATVTAAPASSGATMGDNAAGSNNSLKSQQNWKESKVLWRNREQELNDPDFTRNHDAYRPSRDPQQQQQYGGGRFANGGGQFYDGPRSYGYQSAAQPPFPGRGRGPPPPPPPSNEYSRIDPMQRSMQHGAPPPPPPPPPPADYYRHPGHIHPPPPPSGGFHTSYSPHGRGGYAPPSSQQQQQQQQQQQYHHHQHHHQQQQPLRRGSAGGGGAPVGGYNEAFPPLGK